MRRVLIGLTAGFLFSTGAYAGSVDPVPPQADAAPVYAAPAELSWSGFYAGLAAGQGMGDQTYLPSTDYDIDGDALGVFVGYNLQMEPYLFGLELAATKGPLEQSETDGSATYPDYRVKNLYDLKARAGVSFGKLVVSGILGYSSAQWDEDGTSADIDGFSYGIGADYLVNDRIFIGAEYLSRNLDNRGSAVSDFDSSVNTLLLRAGMKF